VNETPQDNPLVLTTETLPGLGGRIFILSFFGGLAAAVSLLIYVGRDKPIDDEAVLALALLQLMIMGTSVFVIFITWRGTWVLDNDAVTYCPCHRRSRALRWSSVDRLKWRDDAATLKGGEVQIVIPWTMFVEAQRLPARAFAEARLSSSFDLKDVRWADSLLFRPEISRLAKLAYLAKLVAIGIGLAVPWVILVLIAQWLPMEGWLWYRPLFAGFTAVYFGGLMVYALILAHGERGPVRRIHPEWPWRLRRTGARKLTSVGAANDPWLDEM
jgi:hypothetical protein